MTEASWLGWEGPGGAVLCLALGLVAGSFASAASHRLPRGEPLGLERSRCPACGHPLAARDLVPLASWLALGGRCRYCGAPISRRYPAIELVCAALFVAAWALRRGDPWSVAMLCLTALGLVIVAAADLESRIIPDKALIALVPVALAWRWHADGDWLAAAAGAALGFALFWALRAGFRTWRGRTALGLGDVKFMALAGIYVGMPGVAAIAVVGGAIGIAFGIAWKFAGRGASFPFGPALAAGLALCLVFPEDIGGLFASAG